MNSIKQKVPKIVTGSTKLMANHAIQDMPGIIFRHWSHIVVHNITSWDDPPVTIYLPRKLPGPVFLNTNCTLNLQVLRLVLVKNLKIAIDYEWDLPYIYRDYAERPRHHTVCLLWYYYAHNSVNTVKLVYKDHPRDQQNMVLIHRWSLYTGSISWTVYTSGLLKCGLYKQVVFICRWSLEQVSLYFVKPDHGKGSSDSLPSDITKSSCAA